MALYHDVKPWKPCIRCTGAFQTVELPAGTLERTKTGEGDILDLNGVLTTGKSNQLKELFHIMQPVSGQPETSAPIGEKKS